MNILDARNDLLVDADSCLLVESLVFDDVVEEFTVGTVLHHQVQLRFSLNYLSKMKNSVVAYLIKLNDVGVSDFLKNFDFSGDAFDVLFLLDPRFFEDFDGNLIQTINFTDNLQVPG